MGFRLGEYARQSSTLTPWSLKQLQVPLGVCAGARFWWKNKISRTSSRTIENLIRLQRNIKTVSRKKHEVLA